MRDWIKFEIEFLIFIIKVVIGILGENIEIQFLAKFHLDFNNKLNQIWILVFLYFHY
jgi:hypothetical protein